MGKSDDVTNDNVI